MSLFEEEDNEFEEEDAFLDGLIEMLASLPKPEMQMVDPKRLGEMMRAKRFLEIAFDVEKVEVEFHSLGSSGALCVESDSLEACELAVFTQAIHLANNFEIYPQTNGKVRFAMMFYGLMRTVAYQA